MADSDAKGDSEGVLAQAKSEEEIKRGTKRPAEVAELDQEDHLKPTPAKLHEREHVPDSDASNTPETSDKKAASLQGTGASSSESVNLQYCLVSEEAGIQPALAKLRERSEEYPFLAVDCEGENLSRKGKLSIVSVATHNYTYLFDIEALGAKVFDEGLRELLEDSSREKLMFDCRQDSDCLWHQFKVKLVNVVDLQLMQVIYRETHPEPKDNEHRPRSARNCIKDQPRVRSLLFCLKTYVKNEGLIEAKEHGKYLMHRWMERPLPGIMLRYAVADVRSFFNLYDKLKECAKESSAMARLRQASQSYLDFFRSRKERLYNEFETNSFLPWRLLPAYAGCSYYEQTMCVGCKRSFPRGDFSNIQLRNGVQKCPVCKRVKEDIDTKCVRIAYYDDMDMDGLPGEVIFPTDDGRMYNESDWIF